jgi:hypothetical protein
MYSTKRQRAERALSNTAHFQVDLIKLNWFAHVPNGLVVTQTYGSICINVITHN